MSLDLNQLNAPQRDAVTTIHGPVLILAGAGTGKTKAITFRVAHMIEKGVAPDHILAMTFTNKAAKEMRERFGHLLHHVPGIDPKAAAKKVVMGTFHSFCVRVLRQEIENLGYGKNFTIYDQNDQTGLIKKIIARISGVGKLDAQKILSTISLGKNRGLPMDNFTGDELYNQIGRRYQEQLKLLNAVDFDDLLVLTVRLMKQFPEARQRLRNKHRYLLVDEYQDTNALQFEMLKLLVSDGNDLCVVGDDDQSIYSWRGAESGNILDFSKHFPGGKTIKLEQNYRCTPTILNLANKVIGSNVRRHAKKLWSAKEDLGKVKVLASATPEMEAEWIINDMARKKNASPCAWDDFVILYRANALSRIFEQELRRCRIPYQIIGGMSFYERREVKDITAYLEVLLHPQNDIALLRIINTPARGIGATTIEELVEYSRSNKQSIWQTVTENANEESKKGNALKAFVELIQRYQEKLQAPDARWSEVIRLLTEELQYFKELDKTSQTPEEAVNRGENVREWINALAAYQQKGEGNLQDFIDSLTLGDKDEEEKDDEKNYGVKLMTLHGAKGLEFPHVYLVGLEDGLLPHANSKLDGNIDEERRLLYVGITRAKQNLVISHCVKRKKYGQDEFCKPSPFLNDFDEALIEKIHTGNTSVHTVNDMTNNDNPLTRLKARLAAGQES